MVGQELGHYQIIAKIGEGGMGVVYRAYDKVLHRDVAIKVVNKNGRLDPSVSQNLLHEARASSSLSHPNICTIYEVGETDGELYIAMELIEGKSLRDMSGDVGLPPESVLRYGGQIASALSRAHDRGIVHRDLKTANIVVTADGLVKVLDFGLAKQVGSGIFESQTRSFATLEGASSVSGTLPYMAPEILRGGAADYRSDLWALGVVLYESASGRLPFEGQTGFEISSAILREIPNPLGPPVPPGLWGIIQRCLAKEPTQRYQRAGEVQAALEAIQSGAIVSADPGLMSTLPGLRCCIACVTRKSRKATFFCWWGQRKEPSSFVRTRSAAVGRSVVPISTDTTCMRWPTMAAAVNTAFGLRRRIIGERSCDRATTSERVGPTRSKRRFDFPRIQGFP